MSRFPENHPLHDAPEDLIECLDIAHRYGHEMGLTALDIRMRRLAITGDKQANALVDIADSVCVRVQFMSSRDEIGPIPERMDEIAHRLIHAAIGSRTLNQKMAGRLFGVGLVTKAERTDLLRIVESWKVRQIA